MLKLLNTGRGSASSIKLFMNRFSAYIAFFIFLIPGSFFVHTPEVAAEDMTREEIIAARLDCFSRAAELPSLDWDAICDVSNSGQSDDPAVEQVTEDLSVSAEPVDESPVIAEPPKRKWFVQGEDLDEFPAGSLTGNDPLKKIDISVSAGIYKEDREGTTFGTGDDFTGGYYGIRGIYEFRRFENEPVEHIRDLFSRKSRLNMFAFDAAFSAGQLSHGGPGIDASVFVPVLTAEGRALIGYDFPLAGNKLITIFGGFGYRFDRLDNAARNEGFSTYDFSFSAMYMPLGAQFEMPLRDRWRIAARGEYDFMTFAKIDGQKEDMGNYQDQKWDLTDGYGVRASARLTRMNPTPPDFYLEPYVVYWHFQQSEVSAVVFNNAFAGFSFFPDWNSIEYGVRIGFVY